MWFELDYRRTVLIADWRRKVFGLRRRTEKGTMEDIGGEKCGAKNENRKEGKCLEKGKYLMISESYL